MALLSKKILGVGLTLLGGLTLAHGASAGRAWETLLGLLAERPWLIEPDK
jgi:hypothetical protein